ncbi:MAG: zinc transporter ZupT, partial [Lentisphaerae bacterium]|nr:zinc transporter ZupT [Lentisphaerota bacterium]
MDVFPGANVWFALGLTVFAGLATGIGSLLAFFTDQTNRRFLAVSLGFSAGVMIYVSMVEIFFKGRESLVGAWGEHGGQWGAAAAFFGGILLIGVIDKLIPSFENPHEMHGVEELDTSVGDHPRRRRKPTEATRMLRTGIFTAIAITVHNFPEGLATFVVALRDPRLGVTIAIAIALHNIPEGIAVSIPIYYATGSRRRALLYSFLSGLAEPLGAIVGFALLMPFLSEAVFGLLFSGVAGIMVFISLDQLLP